MLMLMLFSVVFCFVLFFWCIYYTLKKQKQEKEGPTSYRSIYNIWLRHSDGLPLAAGASVHVYYCEDRFIFVSDSQRYTLNLSGVKSINTSRISPSGSKALINAAAGKYVSKSTVGGIVAAGIADTENWYFTISYVSSKNELKTLYFKVGREYTYCKKIQDNFYKNHSPMGTNGEGKLSINFVVNLPSPHESKDKNGEGETTKLFVGASPSPQSKVPLQ